MPGPQVPVPQPSAQLPPGSPPPSGNNPFLDPSSGYYKMRSDPNSKYGLPDNDPRSVAWAVKDYSNSLMGRSGPQIGLNEGDLENAKQSRAQQQQGLGLMQQYAQGNSPSVANAQMYGQMGQNIAAMNAASQGGHAASAIQSGNPALASVAMQGGQARAAEQAGLMGAYGQGAASFRQNDQGQYGADTQQALRSQQLSQAQNMLNANTNFGFLSQEQQRALAQQAYSTQLYQNMIKSQNASNTSDSNALVNSGVAGGQVIMSAFSDERLKTSIVRGRR